LDIPFYREYELPWSVSTDQEQRFRRILAIVCGVLLVFGLIWPWLPVPERDPLATEEIPERFAKLLLEERTPPPPPPPPQVEELPEEPEPVVAEETVPEEVVPEPQPEPEPVDRVEQAREKASVAGLLPFADELADLRDNEAVAAVKADKDLSGSVGTGPSNERSLITSNVAGGSGGINTASLSRNTGGSGLAARNTTKVENPVAGVGGGGDARRTGDSGKASRSREEIELVFDRNKGAIYALYNRALRRDPTLQGKLVLRLTIAPSGAVTACEIVSSDLGDDELERKLVQRVRLFRFDAKDVEAVTTTKPIDFFPA